MILHLKVGSVSNILMLSVRFFQARGAKYLNDRNPYIGGSLNMRYFQLVIASQIIV